MVLAIFDIFGCHAGDKLVLGNLIVVGAKHGLAPFDIDAGLETGCNEGWFQQLADKTISLTDKGFAVIMGQVDDKAHAIGF